MIQKEESLMNIHQKLSLSILSVSLMAGCAASGMTYYSSNYVYIESTNQDEYQEIIENDFVDTDVENSSAISLSANTASYSNLRSAIENDREIDPNQIRIEEIINAVLTEAKVDVVIPPGISVMTIGVGNLGAPVVSQGATTTMGIGDGIIR
jgi:hypothetical protein